jgi:rSAM/selenodomain-associated transferase 2
MAQGPVRLSIVMPVLNEAAGIERTLDALRPLLERGAQLLLVDGGSTDGTPELVRSRTAPGVQIIASGRGRALQMNAGASAARGEHLLFLHADTLLPQDADRLIDGALAQRAWGRFDVQITGSHPMLRVVAAMMNLRSRLTGIATGDQALFVRRDVFQRIGGFPQQPLMEDIALSRRLKRVGTPACLHSRVITSGRRWEQHGVWRTIALMWRLRLAYFLGAAPERLHARYERKPS